MKLSILSLALCFAMASAFAPVATRSSAASKMFAVEGPATAPLEYDDDGWPIVSRDPMEPLPEAFVEKQRVALEELRKELLRERFERESAEAPVFGWTKTAEVWNARAAMFGVAVGLLTEYWTGESLVEQYITILRVMGFLEL